MHFKKTVIASAVAAGIGLGAAAIPTTASADVIDISWTGLFTMLDPTGSGLQNSSQPYYYDPTWGYGFRTQISGTMQFDTATGAGTATLVPFQFFNGDPTLPASAKGITLQAIGDGNGSPNGPLVQAGLLFDWNGNYNINVGLILDASGFFGSGPYSTSQVIDQASVAAFGALPASELMNKGKFPVGVVPIATTTYDSAFPLAGDGIGGIPMTNGPFVGFNANFDITSLHIDRVSSVPVPAAVWLFGSGLVGLVGVARRRKA